MRASGKAHAKELTENLLELHDARVGADVLDSLLLLGLLVGIVKDVVEGEGLLRHRRRREGRHDGRICGRRRGEKQ